MVVCVTLLLFCILAYFGSTLENAEEHYGPAAAYDALFDVSGYPLPGDIPILNRKIFKGYRVGIREHPYVVSVRRQLSHYLTAALISRNIVITVAHPLHLVPIDELSVVVGQNYADRGTTQAIVLLVVFPEAFDPNSLRDDLALMKLYEDIVTRPAVKYIKLTDISLDQLNNSKAFVSGWGRCDFTDGELCLPRGSIYYPNEKLDPMLRSISFEITLPNFYCDGYKRQEVSLSVGMMCMGVARSENPVAPCLAVPGAPLVANGRLAGLLSWGFGCGYSHDLPLVYTNIKYYKPWILHNISVLNGIQKQNFTDLFQATRAYITYAWLTETRQHKPVGFDKLVGDMKQTDLDVKLAELDGYYYDIRDFVGNGRFRGSKLKIVEDIRHEMLKLSQLNSTMRNISMQTHPFLGAHWLSDDDSDNDYNDT